MEGHPAVVNSKWQRAGGNKNSKLHRILRCTFGLVSCIVETTVLREAEHVGTKLSCL